MISLYGLPKWIRAKKASSARELGLNAEVIQIDPDFGDELLHGHDYAFGYGSGNESVSNSLFIYLDGNKVAAIEAYIGE